MHVIPREVLAPSGDDDLRLGLIPLVEVIGDAQIAEQSALVISIADQYELALEY